MKVNKDQIIRKALVYFASHDYERASLNDIAGALDITKGGIYHYFRSKDELFRDVVLYVIDFMQNSMDQTSFEGMESKEYLEPLFDLKTLSESFARVIGVDMMKDYKAMVYLTFTAIKKFPEIEEKMRESYTSIMGAMEMFFRSAAEKGDIRNDIDFEALTFLFSAYLEGGMLISGLGAEKSANMNERVFNMFWALLTGERND